LPQYVNDEVERGREVFACAHGFIKRLRRKEFAVPPRLMYADLDEADPRSIAIRPSIAFESSPGRFVGIWLTHEPITWELNRRINHAMSKDPSGWIPTKVLRLIEAPNFKYASMPMVRVLWADDTIIDPSIVPPAVQQRACVTTSTRLGAISKGERLALMHFPPAPHTALRLILCLRSPLLCHCDERRPRRAHQQ
jgi:hypothetical protein